MLSDGKHAVASDPDRDRIYVVDLAARSVAASVVLERGDEPGRSVEDAAGRVHVVLRRAGQVLTLAAPTYAAPARRSVCPAPRGIAYQPKGDRLVVACAGGELITLPAAGDGRVRTLWLERDLRDVVVAGDRLLVTRFRSAEVVEVAPEGAVISRKKPAPGRNLFRRGATSSYFEPSVAWRALAAPGGDGVVMVHQRAFTGEVSTTSFSNAAPTYYGPPPGDPGCGGIVQTAISVVGGSGAAAASPAIGNAVLPVDVALSPDGLRVAMVSAGDAHIRRLGSQVIVSDLVSVTHADDGCVALPEPPRAQTPPPRPKTSTALDAAAPPDAADSSGPDAGADAGVDAGVDAGTPDQPDSGIDEESPIAPEAIEIHWSETYPPTPTRNRIGAEAVAVAFTMAGDVIVQTRQPAALVIGARGIVIPLARSRRYDTGHAIFHSNTGAQIACASCHPEGADDGQVWKFTAAEHRRTQALRGGLLATAPFHWAGDMRDLGQIMTDVFSGRMAGPMLSADRVHSLGRWLDALPVPSRSAPPDAEAVLRGQALFEDPAVGCASCHSGPRFTNNQTVDVGTGRPMQVPSLVDVAARAPFMHDGCAPTLMDRFGVACSGKDDRHGAVSRLSVAQREALVAYLETL